MKRTLLAVGLAVVCLTRASPAGATALDHLKCFKIKDPQAKASYTADLDVVSGTAGGISEPGCKIKVPAVTACVPTVKTNVTPTPPGIPDQGTPNSFFCYKVKCPPVAHPALSGTDQFGSRTVEAKSGAKLLCAPLAGQAATTTTTTASTTTTSTMMTGCPLPATGQTTAYMAQKMGGTAPVAVPDDGTVRAGAPLAYTDNGDGTVTDLNTGLMWEQKSSDGSLHDKANMYVWSGDGSQATILDFLDQLNASNFAGHSDWRIPNVKELYSIIDYETLPVVDPVFNHNCVAGCGLAHGCSCTAFYYYWSSTTPDSGNGVALFVDFGGGIVNGTGKGSSLLVRAVRGGS